MPEPCVDLSADFALAQAAAIEAADHALWLSTRGFETWDKSRGNPVTSADLAVDGLLKERLLGARPGYGWLSEETADSLDRLDADALWVVDPIDGTRDYARGRDGWAVSVALVVRGEVRLGVLVAPALERVFAATPGLATLNGAPIAVSGRVEEAGVRLPVDPQFASARLWPEPFEMQAVAKPNSLALRMALVACGEADGFIDGRVTNEWDVAAASLIVTAAGGAVTDREGSPFAFNKPEPEMPGVVAATPALHARLAERLAVARATLKRAGIVLERD
ncbi:MAG: 3'(2'),5'-bisphosphate nucleotidase CysQ [Sphingomonadaceae bacterium]